MLSGKKEALSGNFPDKIQSLESYPEEIK